MPTYVEIVNSSFVSIVAQGGLTSNHNIHILIEGIESGGITTAKVAIQTS